MSRALRRAALAVPLLLPAIGALPGQTPEGAKAAEGSHMFAAADYAYSYFHGDLDPWQLVSVSLGQRSHRGTFIARANFAQRFASNGAQVEVDAYPRIGNTMYAYMNVGYSNDAVFPAWRSGAELFVNLPRAWEASAGYRQLRFGGAPVTLLTGAVGKYIGNSWLSLRPYLRVKSNSVTASVGLTGRVYGADADNYLGARVSAGTSPSDRVDPSEIARTNAASAALQGSRTLARSLVGTWSASVENEQISSTVTRHKLELSLGLRRNF